MEMSLIRYAYVGIGILHMLAPKSFDVALSETNKVKETFVVPTKRKRTKMLFF
jgi:hypothetical protein